MKKVFVFITILALSLNMVSPAFATVEAIDDAPSTLQSSSVQYSLLASSMASLGLSFIISASGISFGSDEATEAINGIYADLVEATADYDWDFVTALAQIGALIASGSAFGINDISYFDDVVTVIENYTGTSLFGDDYTASDATGSYVIYTPTGEYEWVSLADNLPTSIAVSELLASASSSGMTLLYNHISNPIFYGVNDTYFFFADGDAVGDTLYGSWDFYSAVQGSVYSYGNSAVGLGDGQDNLGWAVLNATPGVIFKSEAIAQSYSDENNTAAYSLQSGSTIDGFYSSSSGSVYAYLSGLAYYYKGNETNDNFSIKLNLGSSFTASEVQTETNVYTTYASTDNITTDISTGTVAVQGGTSLDNDTSIEAIISIMTPALIQELISTGLLAETLAQALGETSTDTDTGTGDDTASLGFLESILDVLSSVYATVLTIPTALTNIYEFIVTLPTTIAQGISDIYTTAETAFVEAIVEPYEYVTGKFEVIEVIYTYCVGVFDEIFIDDPEPPVIWIDFSKSESDTIQYYGMVKVLDLSWYADYKAYGDMLIAGILWVFFIWRLLARLPDIIRGSGMQVGNSTSETGISLRND